MRSDDFLRSSDLGRSSAEDDSAARSEDPLRDSVTKGNGDFLYGAGIPGMRGNEDNHDVVRSGRLGGVATHIESGSLGGAQTGKLPDLIDYPLGGRNISGGTAQGEDPPLGQVKDAGDRCDLPEGGHDFLEVLGSHLGGEVLNDRDVIRVAGRGTLQDAVRARNGIDGFVEDGLEPGGERHLVERSPSMDTSSGLVDFDGARAGDLTEQGRHFVQVLRGSQAFHGEHLVRGHIGRLGADRRTENRSAKAHPMVLNCMLYLSAS